MFIISKTVRRAISPLVALSVVGLLAAAADGARAQASYDYYRGYSTNLRLMSNRAAMRAALKRAAERRRGREAPSQARKGRKVRGKVDRRGRDN